jgi:hypothetical protein
MRASAVSAIDARRAARDRSPMTDPTWLVVPGEGQATVTSTPQAVHQAIATSRLAPSAQVSADGGRTWMPAMHALDWYRSQATGMALIVPTRVEPNAVIAGYLGIFSVLFFGGPFALIAVLVGWDGGRMSPLIKLGIVAGALVLGPLPVAWPARKGQLALRADPSLNGMGRVWTAYVCAGLMALGGIVGLLGVLVRAVIG